MNHMGLNGGNMPNGISGMAGMQAAANGAAQRQADDNLDFKCRLNTYIYDYLLKNEQWDAARALFGSNLQISVKDGKKRPNGMGNDAMDTDSKDKIDINKPEDLPYPDYKNIAEGCFENSFLLDWFTLFWEVFMAPRANRHPKLNPHAIQYMNHTREQSRLTNEQRQNLLRQPGMNPQMAQYRNLMTMNMQRNARMNPAAMQNLTPQQQQQVMQRHQIMQHQQTMERGGSDVDMNGGPRPRSPSNGIMQGGMEMQNPDFYANGSIPRQGMAQGVNGQGGNHALQDYQMQLMLLEQQNKKRLLMARQEQDNLRPDQQGNMGGQQAFAPGMSPQDSRSGPSPNPTDQMKRGTPKLNQSGLPGSPMPDGNIAGRGSPGAMNFNGGMPMEMMKAMGNAGGDGLQIGINGNAMRPPSSTPFHSQMSQQQMEMMRAQSGRIANGANWAQGPPGPQQMGTPQTGQVSGPVGAGTPQQGRATGMPPPQNPGTGNNQNAQAGQNNPNMNSAGNANNNGNNNNANGRPASPAVSASAGTPQASHKPAPSKKAKSDDSKKKRQAKSKAAPAPPATPSAEGDNQAPTPQAPQTPATPMLKSFNSKGEQPSTSNAQTIPPAPASAPVPPQNDTNMIESFQNIDSMEANDLSMDFGNLEGEDVLNQFDFDQFISNDNQEFDLSAFDYTGMDTGNEV